MPNTNREKLIEVIAHVMLWANGSTYDTPQDAARALLKRLDKEGFRIVAKDPGCGQKG